MTKIFATLSLILLANIAVAADAGFPGIETLMTTAERRAAGIEELSAQQLDALNAWIERYTTGTVQESAVSARNSPSTSQSPATPVTQTSNTAQPAPADNFRKPPEQIDYVSRIDGAFEGWSGRTRFTLENGQVWEQRRGNRWKISLDRPEVRIHQNFMGAFEMEVLSEGRSIGVRRIR